MVSKNEKSGPFESENGDKYTPPAEKESGQGGRRTMEERKSTTRAVPLLDKTGAD